MHTSLFSVLIFFLSSISAYSQQEKISFGILSGENFYPADADIVSTTTFTGLHASLLIRMNLGLTSQEAHKSAWYLEVQPQYLNSGINLQVDKQSYSIRTPQLLVPVLVVAKNNTGLSPRAKRRGIHKMGKAGLALPGYCRSSHSISGKRIHHSRKWQPTGALTCISVQGLPSREITGTISSGCRLMSARVFLTSQTGNSTTLRASSGGK
jgi:hypothetical protein